MCLDNLRILGNVILDYRLVPWNFDFGMASRLSGNAECRALTECVVILCFMGLAFLVHSTTKQTSFNVLKIQYKNDIASHGRRYYLQNVR